MFLKGLAATILAASALGQAGGPRRRREAERDRRSPARWERWVSEPRSAVLFVLFSVLVLGGGRKLLLTWRARGAIGQLDDANVTPEAVAAAAEHGRAGLIELFRILGSAGNESLRDAAGHALSVIWARDELIAEEEKALVRRGFQVRWKARRRYPRALRSPIPVSVDYGIPFLKADGAGVGPGNLEWSHRVAGARRASLEVFSPWVPGQGRAEFELVPADFETEGPHKLILQTRVRTLGLTASWELELPHVPFNFEFDPRLEVDALCALPDESRAIAIGRAIRLASGPVGAQGPKPVPIADSPLSDAILDFEAGGVGRAETVGTSVGASGVPVFLALNDGLAVRDMPAIEIDATLPCDLAHSVEIEFSGVPVRYPAGSLTLSGQGDVETAALPRPLRFPIGPITGVTADAIERPGVRPIRARLVPDPDRGWADPDVRSIWPGTIETDWVEVEIIRR